MRTLAYAAGWIVGSFLMYPGAALAVGYLLAVLAWMVTRRWIREAEERGRRLAQRLDEEERARYFGQSR